MNVELVTGPASNGMKKLFNKTFFKFLFGFIGIIIFSLFLILLANYLNQ